MTMAYSLTWLPEVLHGAGLEVSEVPGWQTRGHGDMGNVQGILCHHTACRNDHDDHPSLGVVTKGRPDLAGPLAQLLLSQHGIYYVVAAGKCWHAGAGNWHGVTNGNSHFIGIEAENTGLGNDPWTADQMSAYHKGCAAILKHIGAGPQMCAGHREYALPHGRKSDPNFDMVAFRAAVGDIMGVKATA